MGPRHADFRGTVLPIGKASQEALDRLNCAGCHSSDTCRTFHDENRRQLSRVINPWIGRAGQHTLRGSEAIKLAVRMTNEERQWTHDGKGHGVLRFDVGNTHGSEKIIIAPTIQDAVCRAVREERISYTESGGMLRLRKAIAEAHGINPEEVFFVNGVTEAVMFTAALFSNTNGNIVLPKPVYPPWAGIMLIHGVSVQMAERLGGSGAPDTASIASKLNSATNAVTLISVDNPTGLILGMESVETVARTLHGFMRSVGRPVFLIIDDIYAEYVPADRRNRYFAVSEAYGVPMLYMSGIDKTVGTGFHGGYLIVHVPDAWGEVRSQVMDMVNTTFAMYLGANTLTQYAALSYFEKYEDVRAELETNFRTFAGWAAAFEEDLARINGIQYYLRKPDLPLYHWLRLPDRMDSERFARALVEQHGLCVTPGAPFGVDDGIRVVMVRDPRDPINVARVLNEFIG